MTQYEKSWRATAWYFNQLGTGWKLKHEQIVTATDPLTVAAKLFPDCYINNKVINQSLIDVHAVYHILSPTPEEQTEYLLVLVRC